jgi:hypothetical protein
VLALAALWQQKLRSTLTTLGVVFGSFVLLASLAVRDGVRERVVQEHARFRELREVRVYPGERAQDEPPTQDLEVHGQMSEAKRQRLREEMLRMWQWRVETAPWPSQALKLTGFARPSRLQFSPARTCQAGGLHDARTQRNWLCRWPRLCVQRCAR